MPIIAHFLNSSNPNRCSSKLCLLRRRGALQVHRAYTVAPARAPVMLCEFAGRKGRRRSGAHEHIDEGGYRHPPLCRGASITSYL